jgi:(E)-4-hydroxy-3-methylbut-2-enyl-diphosphate synthase
MASSRQIMVGGVPVGGGAPVAVQTMTKTETANLQATMDQIHKVAEAGADIVRVAIPRDRDVAALKTIVVQSPIPVIADIHFNHTLALKAIDAGAHCIRLNPGNIGGPEKVAEVVERAKAAGTPMRIGVNSGSLPRHLHALERENPVEALTTAATEFVELMHRLGFYDFKVSIKSTNVPNTIASNRLLSEKIDHPLHLGITEAGTKWSGSLKSAVGLGTLLADGIGDTIRISLSTFHAEEEVKVAWEILKALQLRERGPVLIACPTCGRLQRHRRGVARGLRDHRSQGRGPDLQPRQAAAQGPDRAARRRPLRGDRQVRDLQAHRRRRARRRRGRRLAAGQRGRHRDDARAPRRAGGRRVRRPRRRRRRPGVARPR